MLVYVSGDLLVCIKLHLEMGKLFYHINFTYTKKTLFHSASQL